MYCILATNSHHLVLKLSGAMNWILHYLNSLYPDAISHHSIFIYCSSIKSIGHLYYMVNSLYPQDALLQFLVAEEHIGVHQQWCKITWSLCNGFQYCCKHVVKMQHRGTQKSVCEVRYFAVIECFFFFVFALSFS